MCKGQVVRGHNVVRFRGGGRKNWITLDSRASGPSSLWKEPKARRVGAAKVAEWSPNVKLNGWEAEGERGSSLPRWMEKRQGLECGKIHKPGRRKWKARDVTEGCGSATKKWTLSAPLGEQLRAARSSHEYKNALSDKVSPQPGL